MPLHLADTISEPPGAGQQDAPTEGASPARREEQVARQTASQHQPRGAARQRSALYADFRAIANLLAAAQRHFRDTTEDVLAVSYAAEWLLDNYYLIQQALRQIKQDLPPAYYAELPLLGGDDPLAGYPRVYAVALAILGEADYQLDAERIVRFVLAYQSLLPLKTSELWALPIMLRLACLQMVAMAAGSLAGTFPTDDLPESMVVFQAAANGSNDRSVEKDEAAVAHAVPSLRLIESLDWTEMFERVSLVHQALCQDPCGVYPHLDFATRDRYRKIIETLQKGVAVSELEIAEAVVDLAASQAGQLPADQGERSRVSASDSTQAQPAADRYPGLEIDWPRAAHVGFYLIDDGRPLLEERLGYRPATSERIGRWVFDHSTGIYFASVGLVTLASLALVSVVMLAAGGGPWALAASWLLAIVPALTAGVGFTNWLITHTVPPRVLPKLDFEGGVPDFCRTALVAPALIAHQRDIDHLVQQMEQHYLRNPDPQFVYVLLTDFIDADQATKPADDSLLAHAQEAIQALNDKVGRRYFYLLHRRRIWNPAQQTWMGWERKRGKLHEFNRLLRGATDTSYAWQYGDLAQLRRIRYVITLDVDTVLPRGAAARLIGALAHPLNRAVFDPATGKVIAGYTVLQPRTQVKPVDAGLSLFTRIFAGDNSLDLYTLAVSDAYQDLFGTGIFVGKGIYDVDAFERSLDGRVPENALLSHDLFEGVHGRAALVSDIAVFEDYPSHYLLSVQRTHRWIRGDWQLAPWLLPRVPRAEGGGRNDLSLIDRWKIFDNLRRSLFAPTLLALLLAGWTVLPGPALVWTGLSLLIPAFSIASALLASMGQVVANWRSWRAIFRSLRDSALRWLMFLAFLPYESQLSLDAIGRTLGRTFITHRNMLEWTSAAQAAHIHSKSDSRREALRRMLPTVVFAAVVAIIILVTSPAALLVAAPFLLTWLLAPRLADWISRPILREAPPPSAAEERQLRALARRTWLFYENFAGPQDNWLPPDHYQEAPRGVVAHRTSPTNIGLYLLSTLAASDFGYVRMADFVLRLRFAFDALNELQRYRGHFLNWIDTSTLQPLPPPYVSTVDSGNLAAALIVLEQGCREMPRQTVWRPERWQGLLDTLALVSDAIDGLSDDSGAGRSAPMDALRACLDKIEQEAAGALRDPSSIAATLARLAGERQDDLNRCLLAVFADEENPIDADSLQTLRLYVARVHQHLEGMEQERQATLPWLPWLAAPPASLSAADGPQPLRQAWQDLLDALPANPRWNEVGPAMVLARAKLDHLRALLAESPPQTDQTSPQLDWCDSLGGALAQAESHATAALKELADLADLARGFVDAMDFGFLYDHAKDLFHIGYNVNTGELDNSYYDLLASEARIASLLAIGKNDVPVAHWLHLARPLTQFADGQQGLLSWSGTMFEYLMPPLLLRTYPDTQFHQTYATVIDRQIDYGREKSVPWGISESGFYGFDAAMNYQYRAFGVPGLGIRRGLGDDLVITPYASLLALPFRPRPVMSNLQRFQEMKMVGRFGLYEAVDYTPERLNLGQDYAIVQSYMAHHQGMILLGIANYLLDQQMVERFHAAPLIESVDLLLQEQIPQGIPIQLPAADDAGAAQSAAQAADIAPWNVPVETPMPQAHYLSNGAFSTLISNAAAGYCAGEKLRLTRWRADTTLDDWGSWVYVQDLESHHLWSAGRQPTGQIGDYEEVTFYPHLAEFRRRIDATSLHMEVFVAPDVNVEVRRVTLTNDSDAPRRLGLASYSEVVLAPAAADRSHQAFSKLFVESEVHPELPALIFRRRPRSSSEAPAFLLHLLVRGPAPDANIWGSAGYSADRAQFIGRAGSQQAPAALTGAGWWQTEWQGATGATLDPIMALGQEMRLPPRTSGQLAFVTIQANTREEALELARRFSTWPTIDRAQARAQSEAKRELRQLGFDSAMFQQALQLLSLALYPHAARRADPNTLAANTRGQPGLWAFGISGDYPILLLHLAEDSHVSLLQEVLQIHTYWRRRGLKIDLVIVNDRDTSYDQGLHNEIYRVIRRLASEVWLNQRGGIFVLRRDQMGQAERILLQSAARVVLDGQTGSLSQHLADLYRQPASLPRFEPVSTPQHLEGLRRATQGWLPRPSDLQFDNGLGGFTADGREYVIYLPPGEVTPAPWINVIAQPEFGFIASEGGLGASWSVNSGENRLTSWRNDPVTDAPAEIIYLRDEETADVWSPTPRPAAEDAPYLIRHGAGYTVYEHHSHALQQQLRVYVAPDAPLKIMRLRLQNVAHAPRRITVTCYAELVLGVDREATQPFLVPEYDNTHGAILVRNPYNEEFAGRVAFLAANKLPMGASADRSDFLGRLGSLQQPAALGRIGLADRVHAGLDPCAALQLHIDLPPDGVEEVWFVLGEGADNPASLALIERFQQLDAVDAAWQATQDGWNRLLDAVTVETPDAALNLLLNRWLPYQTLSCRIWGRSALYQSSGAYGFRDQLQDVLALLSAKPQIAREQILRAAGHQFEAGDVLHWWHPPSGRGVRTRISDDLLWLPYVTARYVAATGDRAILDEQTPFLVGPELDSDEEERYGHYATTRDSYSLLEHCRRAMERGLTAGPHGLPLIGAGDWNDGMNRVGIEGKGESIWLGWFLYATLTSFAELCDSADLVDGDRYRQQAERIKAAVEAAGWDGAWYRRAYYDDGTPLGSAQNRECRIDAIAQSWAVLSAAADPQRARQAMEAVVEHLVVEEARLVLLFAPPFDKTARDPGYIKGYLPGIRENGGQYTHAALWNIWALARLGDTERAWNLFQLINPILRSDTAAKAERYKVEPYVISADVYNVPPHVGRGGWTWYTGSASWMYQVGREAILGLQPAGDWLRIDPCIPAAWPGYQVTWRHGSSEYQIHVDNSAGSGRGVSQLIIDGEPRPGNAIPLHDDGQRHHVTVRLGEADNDH